MQVLLTAVLALFFVTAPVRGWSSPAPRVIVGFEGGVPSSDRDLIGFRKQDQEVLIGVTGGANGTRRSARAILAPPDREVFLQGRERRLYLWSGKPHYEPVGPNALAFWVRVPEKSPLVSASGANTLGVWTYHWQPGDPMVGGKNNQGLMTDSMMHGYSNFRLLPGCEERWLKVVLSPSAFQQQRNYFHWYAAQGVTGKYDFVATIRQLQFKFLGRWEGIVDLQMDEIGLERMAATVRAEPGFTSCEAGLAKRELRIPVTFRNPTDRARRYRYFLSSELGASRDAMYQPMWKHDDLYAARVVQSAVDGDGGLGAVVLVDEAGAEVGYSEVEVPAGGTWGGELVHRLRPEMVGPWKEVPIHGKEYLFRRDTLTTSLVLWDPEEPPAADMTCVDAAPSNADDGRHTAPPGFPAQVRPPEGWRSEDIPLDQVGGYVVTEVTLKP